MATNEDAKQFLIKAGADLILNMDSDFSGLNGTFDLVLSTGYQKEERYLLDLCNECGKVISLLVSKPSTKGAIGLFSDIIIRYCYQ